MRRRGVWDIRFKEIDGLIVRIVDICLSMLRGIGDVLRVCGQAFLDGIYCCVVALSNTHVQGVSLVLKVQNLDEALSPGEIEMPSSSIAASAATNLPAHRLAPV